MWYAEKAVEIVVNVFVGLYELLVFAILSAGPVGIIFGVAIAWIGLRWLVIVSVPIILDISGPLTAVIDLLVVTFRVFYNGVSLALQALISAVNVIKTILFIGGSPLHDPAPPDTLRTITDAQFRAALQQIPQVCPHYNNANIIIQTLFRLALHTPVCITRRYLWPLTWLYDSLEWWSYFYFGSAEPNPNDPDANCNARAGLDTIDFICMGLGGGFVTFLLGVILVIVIVVFAFREAIYDAIVVSLYTVWIVFNAGIDVMVAVMDSVFA